MDEYKEEEEFHNDRSQVHDLEEQVQTVEEGNKFTEDDFQHLRFLCSNFNQLVDSGNEAAIECFTEISEGIILFAKDIILLLPSTTFFVDFNKMLNLYAFDHETLANIFDICTKIISNCHSFGPYFDGTDLLTNAVTLIDSEDDNISASSIFILNELIQHSLSKNTFIDNIETILDKLFSSWSTNDQTCEATCQIFYFIIYYFKYEQETIEDIIYIIDCIMERLGYHITMQSEIYIFEVLYKIISDEKIDFDDIYTNYNVCDYVFRDINFIDLDKERDITVFDSYCCIALKLAILLKEENSIFEQTWAINYPFIKYCLLSQNLDVVKNALYFLSQDFLNDNTENFNHYKEGDFKLLEELLELGDEKLTFIVKKGILKIVHSILKKTIDRPIYDKLIEYQYIQNFGNVLEDGEDEKTILLFLETIFMMYQAAEKNNDTDSIFQILESCNGQSVLETLADHENDEISVHSRELLDIFFSK